MIQEITDGVNPALVSEIRRVIGSATEQNPVHWSVLIKRFVDGGLYSDDQLVTAVNSILLPFGNLRGSNHNFWFES